MAQVRIVVSPDGSIKVAVPGGATFPEARAIIAKLVADLGTDMPITLDGEIEQHKHGPEAIQSKNHTHAH